ncbi:MAG: Ig-like domain-containing protein [Gemmatimonadota bacterium]|nr:Ig-like domain-containing protein [Gemmatimonadota bacterium]
MTRPWFSLLIAAAATGCGYRGSPSQPHTPEIAKLVVTPASDTLAVGASVQLAATAYDGNGKVVSGVKVTWASQAPGVATVDANGLVRGVAAGSAQISAASSVSSAATVTVTPP